MPFFHLKLVAPRKTFPLDASETESPAMAAHGGFRQADAGRAVGPALDAWEPFGLALVENEAEAQALGAADPVIKADLGFRCAVSPVPSLIPRNP